MQQRTTRGSPTFRGRTHLRGRSAYRSQPSHVTSTVDFVPDRLLDDLDAHQRAAVTEPSLPLAILAPAGSGKTRVLTRRIAWRVREGLAEARHVLAVTFT